MAFLLLIVVIADILGGLMIAGVLAAIQWTLEGIFHHRAGVYFGYATLLTIPVLITFIFYKVDEACARGLCIDGGEFGIFVGFALMVSLGLIVMPLVLVSTLRLLKSSKTRLLFRG
jgi:hypothetical protein